MKGWKSAGLIFFTSLAVIAIAFQQCQQQHRNLPKLLQQSYDFAASRQYDSAISSAHQVRIQAKNPNNQAYASYLLGFCWYQKNNLDSSYFHYSNGMQLSRVSDSTDFFLQAKILNALGVIFEKHEMHKRAINYFKESLKILEQHEHKVIVSIYYNLAYNQSQVNDIECVKSYYTALEYATKYDFTKYETMCLNDLGNLMLETKNFESAIEYYENSLKTEYIKSSKKYEAFAYQGMGEANYYLNRLEEAEKKLYQSLDLMLKLEDKNFVFNLYHFLARTKNKAGQLEEAEKLYLKAVDFFPLADLNRDNIRVFKELSKLQLSMGKTKEGNQSNFRHYQEIENYLDQREKAMELVRRDQFELTVSANAAQYKSQNRSSFFKDELEWLIVICLGSLITILFMGAYAEYRQSKIMLQNILASVRGA